MQSRSIVVHYQYVLPRISMKLSTATSASALAANFEYRTWLPPEPDIWHDGTSMNERHEEIPSALSVELDSLPRLGGFRLRGMQMTRLETSIDAAFDAGDCRAPDPGRVARCRWRARRRSPTWHLRKSRSRIAWERVKSDGCDSQRAIRNGRFFVLAGEWKRPRMGLNRENTEMMARRRNATAVAGRSGKSGDHFGSSQAWAFSPVPGIKIPILVFGRPETFPIEPG